MVGRAVGQHLRDHFTIAIHALHLIVRAVVVVQIQPCHRIQNFRHVFRCGALYVRILDAQDKSAAEMARQCPAVQCGTRTADVQGTGWAGGKSGANGAGCGLIG